MRITDSRKLISGPDPIILKGQSKPSRARSLPNRKVLRTLNSQIGFDHSLSPPLIDDQRRQPRRTSETSLSLPLPLVDDSSKPLTTPDHQSQSLLSEASGLKDIGGICLPPFRRRFKQALMRAHNLSA